MNIRDRIKELRRVPANELRPNPNNWRTHPEKQLDAIRGVLAEVGFAGAELARELEDGTLELIDGHARAEVAGTAEVPVLVLDVDEAEANKILATFDPIGAMAESDATKLDAVLRDVDTGSEALQEMLAELATDADLYLDDKPEIVEDEVPEPPSDPITNLGDLWTLGRHRLLCGDSTSEKGVRRLNGKQEPDIFFTDPPYSSGGFQETGKTSGSIGARGGVTIANDNLSTRGFLSLMQHVLANFSTCHTAFVFCDWKMWQYNVDVVEAKGYRVRNMIVWDKMRMGMGMPFRNQHELCVYGSKIAGKIGDGATPNVLQFPRDTESEHVTPKPVELCTKLLNQSPGEIIADPFLGGGTTLIAAEQLDRTCYGLEISPAYCDIIVERWQNLTGEKATRKNGTA